jgi:hypothetical protein
MIENNMKWTHLSWPSGVGFPTLECVPLKISSLIPSGANFGGFLHIGQKTLVLNGPPQVGGGIDPFGLVGPWTGYRVFS